MTAVTVGCGRSRKFPRPCGTAHPPRFRIAPFTWKVTLQPPPLAGHQAPVPFALLSRSVPLKLVLEAREYTQAQNFIELRDVPVHVQHFLINGEMPVLFGDQIRITG